MTSLSLLLWIALGVLLQLTVYLGFVLKRHWVDYKAISTGGSETSLRQYPDNLGEAGAPVIAAWSGYRSFRVDQKIIEDANRSISSFYLVPEDGQPLPAYLPGQFLTFRLDVPTATGRVEQLIRCYSLSDAPCPEGYRISVKRIVAFPPNSEIPGRASNYFHDHVVVGSPLSVRAPSGHFYLDGSDSPVVLIGGGIGITPMLSMLNWCLVNQPNREVWLFYGVRNSREMVMGPTLEALALEHKNFHFRVCFSAPLPKDLSGSDYHLQDRVDIGLLQTQLPSMSYQFYVCGPAPMMESLVPGLDAWGIPAESIHFEAFGPASIKLGTSKSTTSTDQNKVAVKTDIVVTFSSSGKTLQWQPITNSLLEFAESNGISVNSGCRAGSCGSCQTKILSGEVAYQLPPDYDPEPGYCLFCVCTPLTNLVVEA